MATETEAKQENSNGGGVREPVETKQENGDSGNHEPVPLAKEQKVTFLACLLGTVASIGGFMFGYVR